MLNKLDNISILALIIISLIPSIILYYEKQQLVKEKQPSLQYYIQWFIITFILIIFGLSIINEKTKIENNIIVGPMPF